MFECLFLTWEPLILLDVWRPVEELDGVEKALSGGVVDLVEVGVRILGVLLHHLVGRCLQHEGPAKLWNKKRIIGINSILMRDKLQFEILS